jgi:phosphoribosyl-ATP pyrophosphohydrolase/phosphoribosyl-AMP cyclohydrolase/histidinol dehydrogenase
VEPRAGYAGYRPPTPLTPSPHPTNRPRPPPRPRRSGGLWRKGDTSGCIQELKSIRLDCDADALLFTVRQVGAPPAFCHLLTRTCWGEDGGLSSLERTLASRLVDAPAGSYTKRLFDDPALLRDKLLEEAQELIEATDADHVAAEAADLLYFALVRCAAAKVTLADIEAHLNHRALKVQRRRGDAKAYRTAAAAAYLEAAAAAKAAGGKAGGPAAAGGGAGAPAPA